MKIKPVNIITHNIIPKIVALFFAIAAWIYVSDLISSESGIGKRESVRSYFSKPRFTAKKVQVKIDFYGEIPKGYKLIEDLVTVTPEDIVITGPHDLIDKVNSVKTEPINLGEYTRTTTVNAAVGPESKAFQVDGKVVKVYLPVEKIEKVK
ncbi:MAG: YbbR-like domain-containing protein [Candidatus Omnitrophica bacterium]|nr:YbbR-like domain-containing protein [Candidatus Omnitrophota bacterium]